MLYTLGMVMTMMVIDSEWSFHATAYLELPGEVLVGVEAEDHQQGDHSIEF